MRLLKDKRGVVRVIEAFIASLLLMSCLSLVPSPSTSSQDYTSNMVSTAQNALLSLDNNGHLTALISTQNWTALKSSVEAIIPLTMWFNLTVFDKNMNALNPFPISNGGALSGKVVSLDYVCASQNSTFTVYVLRLQLSTVT